MSAKSSLVDRIVQAALQKGAESAQATLRNTEMVDVAYRNDRLKSSQSSQRTEISLKVIVNGKAGASYTTDPEDIDGLVERAMAAVAFGSPALYEFPAAQPAPEVKLFDPEVLNVTRSEMMELGQEMLHVLKDSDPDIVVDAGLQRMRTHEEYANSNGASFSQDGTHYSTYAGGNRTRGTDILMSDFGLASRSRKVDEQAVAREAAHWFQLAGSSATISSGKYPVIFSPEGLIILLLSLRLGLDGKNVFQGESPLAKKNGVRIADARFTLIDNPLIDYGPASSRFDGEGVPCQVTPLIEAGVVKNFFYDLDYASRAGVKSTGNGPGPRPSNWVIPPGDTSLEAMIAGTSEGLLVHSVLGLGQGNPMNGEFSLNLQEGFKIEDGKLVGRVKDVMISGNVYDLLQNILAIGDTPRWSTGYLNYFVPYIQVGGVDVTAKQGG
ncbi:MAG: TldD/PmbA family protein [Omnitrophica WOR_2 bacterium]